MKMKNRKAEAPASTATWLVAIVIISVVMALFLGAVFLLVAGKKVPVFGGGFSSISVQESGGNLIMTRSFSGFLQREVDIDGKRIKNYELYLLARENKNPEKDIFEKEARKFFDSVKVECYILKDDKFDIAEISKSEGRMRSLAYRESWLDEHGSFFVFNENNNEIKLKFYFGKC